MDAFSKDLLRVGTLKGFKYFSCYLRGREELLVEIKKVPSSPNPGYATQTGCPFVTQSTPHPTRSFRSPGARIRTQKSRTSDDDDDDDDHDDDDDDDHDHDHDCHGLEEAHRRRPGASSRMRGS